MDAIEKIKSRINRALDDKTGSYFLRLFYFILLYKTGEYLFKFLERKEIAGDWFAIPYEVLSDLITRVTASFYSLVYTSLEVSAGYVISINGIPTIRMMEGCTGLMQLFQVLFILVLFPLKWKTKALFLPLAAAIILGASVIHYIILVPVAHSFPGQFGLFHDILSRIVFYCFFFLNFMLWNRKAFFPYRFRQNTSP